MPIDYSIFTNAQLEGLANGKPDYESMSDAQLQALANSEEPQQPTQPSGYKNEGSILNYNGQEPQSDYIPLPQPGSPDQLAAQQRQQQANAEHPVREGARYISNATVQILANAATFARGIGLDKVVDIPTSEETSKAGKYLVDKYIPGVTENGQGLGNTLTMIGTAPAGLATGSALAGIFSAGDAREKGANAMEAAATGLVTAGTTYGGGKLLEYTAKGAGDLAVSAFNRFLKQNNSDMKAATQNYLDEIYPNRVDKEKLGAEVRKYAQTSKDNVLDPYKLGKDNQYDFLKTKKIDPAEVNIQDVVNVNKIRQDAYERAYASVKEKAYNRDNTPNPNLPEDSVAFQSELVKRLDTELKALNSSTADGESKSIASEVKIVKDALDSKLELVSGDYRLAKILNGEFKDQEANFASRELGKASEAKSDLELADISKNLFETPNETDFYWTVDKLSKDNPKLLEKLARDRIETKSRNISSKNTKPTTFEMMESIAPNSDQIDRISYALKGNPIAQAKFRIIAEIRGLMNSQTNPSTAGTIYRQIRGLQGSQARDFSHVATRFLNSKAYDARLNKILRDESLTPDQQVESVARMLLEVSKPKVNKAITPPAVAIGTEVGNIMNRFYNNQEQRQDTSK